MALHPGNIYRAFEHEGKRRAFIILSAEQFNRGKYVIAVPVTSVKFDERKDLRNCVPFRAGQFGFDQDCVAQAEQVTTILIDELDIDEGFQDIVDDEAMRDIIRAVGYVMDAECEPGVF